MGPRMVAASDAIERRATSHGTPSLGTIAGGMERSAGARNACPAPKAITSRKMG